MRFRTVSLPEVVVDPVDLRLAEDLRHLAVEALRGLEVPPERLLDDDPPPAAARSLVVEAGAPEPADDLDERRRLGREVEQPVPARAALGVDRVEPGGEALGHRLVVEVAAVVADVLGEGRPRVAVERLDARVLRDGLAQLRGVRLVVVRAPTHGDERELLREQVGPPQLEERRDDLAMREVAGRAEQDEGGRVRHPVEPEALPERVRRAAGAAGVAAAAASRSSGAHREGRVASSCAGPGPAGRSLRLHRVTAELVAERGEDLGAVAVVLARAEPRLSSASVMTGAGTSRSIASWTVQRPSPESATQPLRWSRSWSWPEGAVGQLEQPRAHHRPVVPQVRDGGEVEVVRRSRA